MRLPHRLAWIAVGIVLLPHAACTIDRVEFLCEDAVTKLQGCCNVVPAGIGCTYVDRGCLEAPILPRFDETESRCIISASCSELRTNACGTGFCR